MRYSSIRFSLVRLGNISILYSIIPIVQGSVSYFPALDLTRCILLANCQMSSWLRCNLVCARTGVSNDIFKYFSCLALKHSMKFRNQTKSILDVDKKNP